MLLLPRTIGPLTLTRSLGNSNLAERYAGTLTRETQQSVVVHRLLPALAHNPLIAARVRDLLGVRHPFLVRVRDWVEDGADRLVIEDRVDGIRLETLLQRCSLQGLRLPHNVYLNLATQLCNGLEALHGRPGKGSGVDHVLHLHLSPASVFITREGKVILGNYGLLRSPTILPPAERIPAHLEYLSPEQLHPNEPLAPTSDIFSLGSLLYALLTLTPLFQASSRAALLQRIQAADVDDALLTVRAHMPGLERILQRALTPEARLRYQRAFVLREDLRGLMASYSFSTIVEDTHQFLEPFLYPEEEAPDPDEDDITNIPPASAPVIVDVLPSPTLTPSDDEPRPASSPPPPPLPPLPQTRQPPLPDLTPITINDKPESTAEIAARALARRSAIAFGPPTLSRADEDDVDLSDSDLSESIDPPTREGDAPPPPTFSDLEPDPDSIILPAEPPALSPLPVILPSTTLTPEESAPEAVADAPLPEPLRGEPALRPRPRPTTRAPQLPPELPAPPPRPPAPPPAAAAVLTPLSEEDADADAEDDWRPRRAGGGGGGGRVLLFGAAALVGLLICGGGSYGLLHLSASLGTSLPAPDEGAATAVATRPPEAAAAPTTPEPAPPSEPTVEPVAAATAVGVAEAEVATPKVAAPSSSAVEASRPSVPTSTTSTTLTISTARTPAGSRAEEADDAFAFLNEGDASPSAAEAEPVAVLSTGALDLERYAAQAARGGLGRTDMMALESVALEDADYTRSRALLLMDAQKRGDASAAQRYVDQLMRKPENRYNPIYLTDAARLRINRGDYEGALQVASLAERHWARLPSDLLFLKKAEIYEIQAASYQGLFYASEDDLDLLLKSIRSWERYREHVNSRSRADLASRAERELGKLEDIQRRLEY